MFKHKKKLKIGHIEGSVLAIMVTYPFIVLKLVVDVFICSSGQSCSAPLEVFHSKAGVTRCPVGWSVVFPFLGVASRALRLLQSSGM